jgi:endonuclease/exonuclease/phosphatase family metal-dependent hydrolase
MKIIPLICSFGILLLSSCSSPVYNQDETAVASDTSTPIASDTSTPIASDTSTPIASDTSTPIASDTSTPIPLLSVRLMTYNILFGAGIDHEFDDEIPIAFVGIDRISQLLSYIKEVNPDILGLQELAGWSRGTTPMIAKVADELGMNYYLASAAQKGELHLAILSKYEIVEAENISQEVGNIGALRVKLLTPDGHILNVFVVHLDPFSRQLRTCEIYTLVQYMQPYFNQLTIIMGDFNSGPSSTQLESIGMELVKGLVLDQIWVSPFINWSETEWLSPAIKILHGVSDHRPVSAEISFFPSNESVIFPTPMSVMPTPAWPCQ